MAKEDRSERFIETIPEAMTVSPPEVEEDDDKS